MRIKKYKVRLPEDGSLRPEAIMEKAVNYPAMKRLSSPADIAQLLNDVFSLGLEADEYMYLLTLDTKCRLVGVFEVAHGGVNSCYVFKREILVKALSVGAVGIIVAHNHPSGDPTPSKEDRRFTEELYEACQMVGLDLLDSIVVCQRSYCSMEMEFPSIFKNNTAERTAPWQ